jgi:predicted ABC-type ATPase
VAAERRPTIWVIAGPNGGGKTTIVGEMIRESGADYFDPDEATRRLCERNPGLSLTDANAIAWQESRRRLEASISNRENFAFETTLGGRTIARLLHRAADGGLAVKVWYVALDSADRHVARVKARVARGGHDVAEGRIRERYDRSRATLSRLVPKLAALKVYDNSFEARVERLERPRLRLILDLADGRIRNRERLADTPEWAKPIVAAALKAERSAGE